MSEVLCVGLSCMDVLMKDVDLNTPFVSESKTAGQITVGVGGDAANEAVILSRLGHDVSVMTGIADDGTGDFIKNYLLKNNVDMTSSVITEGGESAVNVIVIHHNGDRNFINSGVPKAADFDPDLTKIRDVKVVSLASMFMPPFEDPAKVKMVAQKAKEAGAVTCLDVIVKEDSRLEEYKEALPYIDYVFPNREEAMQLTGKEELEEIAEVFHSYGVKNVMCITQKKAVW